QFEILNDQIPPTGGACTIPIAPTLYAGEGILDLSIVRSDFTSAYLFFPLIENNLPASTGSIDSNEIQLTGFDLDISALNAVPDSIAAVFASPDAASLLHYRMPWSGGIASGGGRLSAIVEAFPVALAQMLLASGGVGVAPSLVIDLKITALGTTNTGSSMQSDPFEFPVKVCSGCLVANAANVAPCPYTAAPANAGNSCNPAQDDPVDCCTDKGTLICPPPVVSP
ncbi:MAG TPA: hypothetical protein VKO16_06330, partial [Polyangia bacterium]|nr:hypothetical protein [Polyangia bacterium]